VRSTFDIYVFITVSISTRKIKRLNKIICIVCTRGAIYVSFWSVGLPMAIVYHLCFNVDIFRIMVGSDFNQ
jgi:hypothetical protein